MNVAFLAQGPGEGSDHIVLLKLLQNLNAISLIDFGEYLCTGLVETDPEGALAGFDAVVRMEPEKAEW